MLKFLRTLLFVTLLGCTSHASSAVRVGADVLFDASYSGLLRGKKIGLITNQTAINGELTHTIDVLKKHAKAHKYQLVALFAPEHGLYGDAYASENVDHDKDADGIPIYSLHGSHRRPSAAMLKGIDLLIFDIQDLGSRSYTFVTTLFYAMEEAAKAKIPVMVLDRPNPLNGLTVDGPMMEEKWRSMVGYINVPYCHGMTVGELAHYFNREYKVGCKLSVIPMQGWKRSMSWEDTGLTWIPTSPNIPEASTAWFYPTTGILGELQMVSIGIGYTLPFKVVGAPWIDANAFANKLNSQDFPGVAFRPFHYRPFSGKFSGEDCHGVLVTITDKAKYQPVQTQYLIIGILKSLYPKKFAEALKKTESRRDMFAKVNGTDQVYLMIEKEKYVVWKLRSLHEKERKSFLSKRKRYLIAQYT